MATASPNGVRRASPCCWWNDAPSIEMSASQPLGPGTVRLRGKGRKVMGGIKGASELTLK